MKKILFVVVLMISSFAIQAQEIKWMTLNEALVAQKKNPKPIFMDVYTDWCGPCKMLDKNTFSDKTVVDYITANYYPVKFNGEGNEVVQYQGKKYSNPNFNPEKKGRNSIHELTLQLKLEGYPSMFVLDTKADIAKVIVGYYQPEQLMSELKAE